MSKLGFLTRVSKDKKNSDQLLFYLYPYSTKEFGSTVQGNGT